MKTTILPLPNWQIALYCFILLLTSESVMAQNGANVNLDSKIFYYGVALLAIIIIITTVLILRKAQRILGEHGLPLFNPGFPIFKRLTKASTTVAVVMILLVLWGIYLVITYQVK